MARYGQVIIDIDLLELADRKWVQEFLIEAMGMDPKKTVLTRQRYVEPRGLEWTFEELEDWQVHQQRYARFRLE